STRAGRAGANSARALRRRASCLLDRHVPAVDGHLVAFLARGAWDRLERLALVKHKLEPLAGLHPLELESRSHPVHRAEDAGQVQRGHYGAKKGSDTYR